MCDVLTRLQILGLQERRDGHLLSIDDDFVLRGCDKERKGKREDRENSERKVLGEEW